MKRFISLALAFQLAAGAAPGRLNAESPSDKFSGQAGGGIAVVAGLGAWGLGITQPFGYHYLDGIKTTLSVPLVDGYDNDRPIVDIYTRALELEKKFEAAKAAGRPGIRLTLENRYALTSADKWTSLSHTARMGEDLLPTIQNDVARFAGNAEKWIAREWPRPPRPGTLQGFSSTLTMETFRIVPKRWNRVLAWGGFGTAVAGAALMLGAGKWIKSLCQSINFPNPPASVLRFKSHE